MLNKILLATIALGLWANAASTFIHPAHAQYVGCQCTTALDQLHSDLRDVYDAIGRVKSAVSNVESAVTNK